MSQKFQSLSSIVSHSCFNVELQFCFDDLILSSICIMTDINLVGDTITTPPQIIRLYILI